MKRISDGTLEAGQKKAMEKGTKDVKTDLALGDSVERIFEPVKEKGIDTIIMGSRSLGTIKSAFLGSAPNEVCHRAGCTFVTVT